MRVVCIAAECEPWAKTGGLGDVVDALARAVGATGRAGDENETESRWRADEDRPCRTRSVGRHGGRHECRPVEPELPGT